MVVGDLPRVPVLGVYKGVTGLHDIAGGAELELVDAAVHATVGSGGDIQLEDGALWLLLE